MKSTTFIRSRARSLAIGARGVGLLVASQKNVWIHLAATVISVGLGVYLGLTRTEWALVTVAIVMVWAFEGLNTAVETLGDAISSDYHPIVGRAKDIAAGAVLVAALGAAAIGILVFGPHIMEMLMGR